MSTENVYLIKMKNQDEEFFKIGTTVHRNSRFYQLMKLGYEIEIIYMVMGIEFYEALNAETKLQSQFTKYITKAKFGGYSECFLSVDIIKYKNLIHSIITSYKEIVENKKVIRI